jgi:hypothetical protein
MKKPNPVTDERQPKYSDEELAFELWKDIPGYGGDYMVSDLGRIKSKSRSVLCRGGKYKTNKEKFIRYVKYNNGMSVSLYEGKTHYRKRVAELVLNAFIGERPKSYDACHFPDKNISNNRLCNLRWDTHSANQMDKVFHGTDGRGEKNIKAILTNENVVMIKKILRNKEKRGVDIAKEYGVHPSTISKINAGKNWVWLNG